jgi:phosphate:Na+ symporter
MSAEVPRQIANAHTIFNVANTLAFIWLTAPAARLVERLIPERPAVEKQLVKPRYLDEELVKSPAMALARVRLEIGHMGEITINMGHRLEMAMAGKSRESLDVIVGMDDDIDILHESILGYLGKVRRRPLSDQESDDFLELMSASNYLEGIADLLAGEIVDLTHKAYAECIWPSEAMTRMLVELRGEVGHSIDSAIAAIRDQDEVAAQDVMTRKDRINQQIRMVLHHQAERLAVEDTRRPEVFRLEMSLVECLKRIYSLCRRMARLQLPATAVSSSSTRSPR